MIKILEKYYSNEFKIETKTITEKQYEILHEKIENHFGPYCRIFTTISCSKWKEKSMIKKWL